MDFAPYFWNERDGEGISDSGQTSIRNNRIRCKRSRGNFEQFTLFIGGLLFSLIAAT